MSQNLSPKVYENQTNHPSHLAKFIPKPDYERENSRTSSRTSYYNNPDTNINPGYYPSTPSTPDIDYSRIHFTDSENVPYPDYELNVVDPLAHNPSFRAINRSESVKSNQELIKELKVKLKKNSSMRNDIESPYVKCKNLDDVLEVHDRIAV